MREMLEKVPEGDWFCEECQNAEETANQRLGKHEVVHAGAEGGHNRKRNLQNLFILYMNHMIVPPTPYFFILK